jgi:signal transduction histidine kinase
MKLMRRWEIRYGLAIVVLVATLLLRHALVPFIGTGTLYITLFPAMFIVAVTLGSGPALFGTILMLVLIEMSLVEPYGQMKWSLSLAIRAGILLPATFYVGMVGHRLRDARDRLEDRVKERTEELTRHRDHLDELVKERTKDLTRSNHDLEQFAYVASHDLQEPLRAVSGFVGILKQQYSAELNAEAREYIDLSIEGAERMQNLIHDLLIFSRVGSKGIVFASIKLSDAFEGAVENLRALIIEKKARITHGELPVVMADQIQMTQLFQNLIANAIKFHGKNSPEVHVDATYADSKWVIRVKDNGIGIEPQYFDRIFLIFQRLHTRSVYPGTGIGLALCKKIVERHGGSISVESTPGEGTTFIFTIPDKGVLF